MLDLGDPKQPSPSEHRMFISILIPTRNRVNSLRHTLDSLFCPNSLQSLDWEVIVVDNDSTDDTPRLCRDLYDRFPGHFRSLIEKKHGKSHALNSAIAVAKGDVLAFIDDDVSCAPDYLDAIRMVFDRYAAQGVQGRVLLDCEGGRPEWLDSFLGLSVERDCGDTVAELEGTLCGASMIVRAEAVRKIGGFSPELGPGVIGLAEDTELTFRLRQAGCRLIYAPEIVVRHHLSRRRLTKGFIRKRAFQNGRAEAYFAPLPVPRWRFGLYLIKEALSQQAQAIWYLCAGRPALALRCQCKLYSQAGFFWQHEYFKRGITPDKLAANLVQEKAPPFASGNGPRAV